ncbi:hypothetical protein NCS52_01451600 [Fusarium sp. LHS14.1]|nr:hypothetical protein NCS52_01451600 [Fusarium sp. LHS14.1]
MSIIQTFLYTLREKLVERREKDTERLERTLKWREKTSKWHHQFDTCFKSNDPPHTTIQQTLSEASTNEHWTALQAALDVEQESEMSVVIDGLDSVQDYRYDFLNKVHEFIQHLLRRTPKTKILLTSRLQVDLEAAFSDLPCIEYDKERKECLASLRFSNSRVGKISEEHQGSLEWIWTNDQCQKWLETDASRLLYLQGKPGSGKSTLTKYFANHLLERQPNVKSAIVATFFYSWREGEAQRSHYSMLRSILYAILDQHEAFFYHCFQREYRCQLQEGGGGGLVGWDYSSLKRLLSSLRYHTVPERFYLIIDAVDESDYSDRREILDLLLRTWSETKTCVVKTFVASRPVVTLERRISEFHSFIRLQDETQLDILNLAN